MARIARMTGVGWERRVPGVEQWASAESELSVVRTGWEELTADGTDDADEGSGLGSECAWRGVVGIRGIRVIRGQKRYLRCRNQCWKNSL